MRPALFLPALFLPALLCGGCFSLSSGGGDRKDPPPTPDAGPPDACVPLTCLDLGYSCGEADDGCGRQLDCGGCEAPLSCGEEEHVCICQFQIETVVDLSGETEIVREPGGTVHVLYVAGDPGELRHAWRDPDGEWVRESVPEVGEVGWRLRAAIGEGGAMHAVFHDSARGLVYARRSAAGTWSAEVIDADAAASADVALDAAGGVYVSYGTFDEVLLASRSAAASEFSIELVSSSNPDGTAVAVDDRVHVIYLPFFGDSVIHASRASGGGAWEGEPVAEVRGHSFHLAADGGGGLHLLYGAGTFGPTRYALKEAGGAWASEAVAGEPDATSFAVSPAGDPHVAWSPNFGPAEYLRRSDTGDWISEPLGQRAADIDIVLDESGLADIALADPGEPAILRATWPCP